MVRIIAYLLVVMLLASCEQNTPLRKADTSAQTIAALESKLPALMRDNNIPSIGVAVIRDGQVSFVKTFGLLDRTQTNPVNGDTVFEVASLGKPVFAYIAIKLAQRGVFDLDQPLVKYVPNLFSSTDPRVRLITGRMTLSHSSGLPNFGARRRENIEFNPGSDYRYSGVGFEKLQAVLEKLLVKASISWRSNSCLNPLG